MVTGNYCYAYTKYPDHYNRFLVGTVWEDLDADAMYDPGEGIGGVTVMPDQGSYYAETSNSGGYAIAPFLREPMRSLSPVPRFGPT